MNKSLRSGFTLIEMLVVVGVIVLLIGVGLSSLWGSTGIARDKDRINDMEQMRLAVRLYAEANGSYPLRCQDAIDAGSKWSTPGPMAGTWGVQCEEYIVGLVPTYLPELPRDPIFDDVADWDYIYYSDGTDYKFMAHYTAESDLDDTTGNVPLDSEYARCAATCDLTANRCNQPTYAVYSPGAACW